GGQGEAALNSDSDKNIDQRDAFAAVVTAADIIGRKHLRPQALDVIRSKKYRSGLMKIAKHVGPAGAIFERRAVIELLSEDEAKNLDPFLKRMRKLGIIEQGRDSGSYKFATRLAAVYLWMESERNDAGGGRNAAHAASARGHLRRRRPRILLTSR